MRFLTSLLDICQIKIEILHSITQLSVMAFGLSWHARLCPPNSFLGPIEIKSGWILRNYLRATIRDIPRLYGIAIEIYSATRDSEAALGKSLTGRKLDR